MSRRRPLLRHGRLDPLAAPFVDTLNALGPASQHDPHGVRVQARSDVSLFTTYRISMWRGLTATTGRAHLEHPPSWQSWVSDGRLVPAPCLTKEARKERFFEVLRGRRLRFVHIEQLCTQRTLSRQWISPDDTLP